MNPGEQGVTGGLAGRAGLGRELTTDGSQQITGHDSVKFMVPSNHTSLPSTNKVRFGTLRPELTDMRLKVM